jgi:hypothetical protein
MKDKNKNKGLSIQTEAEKFGIAQKYIMRVCTTSPQMRFFKSLLVLRDLTTQDFFHTFFRLIMDEDERIVSLIEEAYKMKKDKSISRLINHDKENIYELIEKHSPIDSGGIGETEYDDSEWGPKNYKQRRRVNREICSRDSDE